MIIRFRRLQGRVVHLSYYDYVVWAQSQSETSGPSLLNLVSAPKTNIESLGKMLIRNGFPILDGCAQHSEQGGNVGVNLT
jgi:hypothetical protein